MRRSYRLAAATLGMWLLGEGLACSGSVLDVPVMTGGAADSDACGTSGKVIGLDPQGQGFLAVRSGPGVGYRRIAKLRNGDEVFMCATAGNWIGIVFSPEKKDCGTGTPRPKREAYQGPCLAGWVYRSYIAMQAG
jgi:hypothetical protein